MPNIDTQLDRFHNELKTKAEKQKFHENPSEHEHHTIFDGLQLSDSQKNLASHFSEHYKAFSKNFESNPNLAIHSLARFGKVFAGNDSQHKKDMIDILKQLSEKDQYKDIIKHTGGNKFHVEGFKSSKSGQSTVPNTSKDTPKDTPEDTSEDENRGIPLTHNLSEEEDTPSIEEDISRQPQAKVDPDLQAHNFVEQTFREILKENPTVEGFRRNLDVDSILMWVQSTYPDAFEAIKKKLNNHLQNNESIAELISHLNEEKNN